MPIYEYRCEKGHAFEVMQKMTDDSLTSCIECGAPVQQVFHPIAVHFKGKGFYNTDYGTKRRNREQAAEKSSASASSSDGASSTSESKPADKPAADKPAAKKPDSSSKTSKKPAA